MCFLFKFFVSVHVYMYVTLGICGPQHECGGQMASLALLVFYPLRWGLLFTAAYPWFMSSLAHRLPWSPHFPPSCRVLQSDAGYPICLYLDPGVCVYGGNLAQGLMLGGWCFTQRIMAIGWCSTQACLMNE